MAFQLEARRLSILLGLVLVTSAIACEQHQRPQNDVKRYGGDVIASGSAPQVIDSVAGDAILAGSDIHFSGATGSDYLGAGGQQSVGGRIHGSIRAAGGEIYVTAAVDRNATIAGGKITLDHAATIGRNAYVAGGTIQIDGTVHEGLRVAGSNVTLDGESGGDVEVVASQLHIGPHATIAGTLRYRVPEGKVRIDPAARISGKITALPIPRRGRAPWFFFCVLWMIGFLVAGGVVVALVPRFATETTGVAQQRPGYTALIGLAWIILIPVASLLAAVTIIGLPLAFLTMVTYFAVMYLSRIPVAIWLGQFLLRSRVGPGQSGVVTSFVTGGLALLVIRLIPVLGSLVMLITTVLGFGAIVIRIQEMRRKG